MSRDAPDFNGSVELFVPPPQMKQSRSSSPNKLGNSTQRIASQISSQTLVPPQFTQSHTLIPPNCSQKTSQTLIPKFEFKLDRSSKDEIMKALESSQRDDDEEPLLTLQPSQSETRIEEKKLADLPMVKAFNEAERKKMSQPK